LLHRARRIDAAVALCHAKAKNTCPQPGTALLERSGRMPLRGALVEDNLADDEPENRIAERDHLT
jgi:hypothetical protein